VWERQQPYARRFEPPSKERRKGREAKKTQEEVFN